MKDSLDSSPTISDNTQGLIHVNKGEIRFLLKFIMA